MTQDFIRILTARQAQHTQLHPNLVENANCPAGSLLARAVRIVGEDDLICIAGKQPRLFAGECRAQAGYRIGKAGLMVGDHVHISFC